MRSIRFGLVALLLVAAAPGCTSRGTEVVTHEDPPLAPEVAVPQPAPVVQPSWRASPPPPVRVEAPDTVEPPSAPPDTAETSRIATLLADLAVAVADPDGKTRLYDGTDSQTTVMAEWAASKDLQTSPVAAGETLYGIGPEGVSAWRTIVKERDLLLHRKGAVLPKRPTVHLLMKAHEPSPKARLEPRRLAPPSGNMKPLREWLTKKLEVRMVALGEVRGVFGGGVDRIVVFDNEDDFDPEKPLGEVALLVAGDTPRELLELDEVMSDIQPAAVLDLDGDGVEEVLWLYMAHAADGSGPALEISYFDGGAHRTHFVLHRSYSQVTEFGGQRRPR